MIRFREEGKRWRTLVSGRLERATEEPACIIKHSPGTIYCSHEGNDTRHYNIGGIGRR